MIPDGSQTKALLDEYGAEDAKRFMQVLCRYLRIDDEDVQAAHEDVYYYLWKEGTLPVNVDVLDNKLEEKIERDRLRRLFDKGIDKVAGYVLPVKWNSQLEQDGWRSSNWTFRRGHLFLLPGDSPIGYRLPLDSLIWVEKKKRDTDPARCTFEPRPPLGDIYGEVARRYVEFTRSPGNYPGYQEQRADENGDDVTSELIHTALCVEPRDGHLYIFMPPLTHLEQYLDLVHSVEATAAELKMPVFMEGYEPPHDHRLKRFAVTPDPGVIEVNIHPAHNWDELVSNSEAVYEEARLTRLGTEKFMLDGRHTGTGGGNHVTIGGAITC